MTKKEAFPPLSLVQPTLRAAPIPPKERATAPPSPEPEPQGAAKDGNTSPKQIAVLIEEALAQEDYVEAARLKELRDAAMQESTSNRAEGLEHQLRKVKERLKEALAEENYDRAHELKEERTRLEKSLEELAQVKQDGAVEDEEKPVLVV